MPALQAVRCHAAGICMLHVHRLVTWHESCLFCEHVRGRFGKETSCGPTTAHCGRNEQASSLHGWPNGWPAVFQWMAGNVKKTGPMPLR